ncbi:MAG: hypothetical protein IKI37_09960 [Oscillospiraceae bacterium]|nr:hypothetical protein [Oscillospiraceae bacterium]
MQEVTISFKVDSELYKEYSDLVKDLHQNVKGNIIRYISECVKFQTADISELSAKKYHELTASSDCTVSSESAEKE